MSLGLTKKILEKRAEMLSHVRGFFAKRGVMEADVSALVRYPSLDANIESIEASLSESEMGYLHTSPEFAMKRLLAEGIKDIYFLGRVYRKNDLGKLHNPEFTMAEWYRINMPFEAFIDETCNLIRLFLGPLPSRSLSYQEAFHLYAGLDLPVDGRAAAQMLGLSVSSDTLDWREDDWLHLILSHVVEPHLGQGELTILTDYPPSQAALSRIVEKEGRQVAERFEIYYRGIELSNGYHELTDAAEQRRRFENENNNRQKAGKKPHPLDERFLKALEKGIPDCCGVSIGFDRLLMLSLELESIHEVLPFSWNDPSNPEVTDETLYQLPLVHSRPDLLHHTGELR